MEGQIGFLVPRMEADRKTDQEEMKASIQSMGSVLDEIIRQQVENVMRRVKNETKDLQKKLN
jgi:hypothetical protein